ncbi:prepilin-type N-terminal cleavage/methylation domain-containing protein [Candidatus Gottesmanbacteria bacterium]|nr:prepilin-type N-terminal cleavage/methylation domain-containing protein [Candidatus Gottesmanbacteria bacterium]
MATYKVWKKSGAGFTLIELLVAATIIAVLISIGVVSYGSVNKRSRDAKRKGDIEQIRSALEMYRSDYGYYPGPTQGCANVSPNWNDASCLIALESTYIPAIPSDPKSGQKYRYQPNNVSSSNYLGYCLSTALESESTGSIVACVDSASLNHNYGAKNP